MNSVNAWLTLADRVAVSADAAAREAIVRAVAGLGLTEGERAALGDEVRGRTDPAAGVVRDILAGAGPSTTITLMAIPSWSEAALDAAFDAARSLRNSVETGDAPLPGRPVADLEALPPDDTAELLVDLLGPAQGGEDAPRAGRARRAVGVVLVSTPPLRLPVADLLVAAVALPVGEDRSAVVRGLAPAQTERLLRGVAEVLGRGTAPAAAVASVLAEVGAVRREVGARGPYRWWRHGAVTEEPVWRGAGAADVAPSAGRAAYVRLDVATGTEKAGVVVVDQPFEVTLGLQPRRDGALVTTSPMTFAFGETVELEAVLLADPASIEVTGSPRTRLTVSDATPYPAVTLTCVARYGEQLAAERRLGVQLLRAGHVVAVAWRTLVAVDDARRVADAAPAPVRQTQLLDLDPLLGEAAPDLVVSVSRADAGADTFVWMAYADDPALHVPDLPSTSSLDGDVVGFALETRRSIQFSHRSGDGLPGARRPGPADRTGRPGGGPGRDPRRWSRHPAGPRRRPSCCSPRS